MKQLTEGQENVLDAVKLLIYDKGYPPTVREIAKKTDLTPGTIQVHLDKLEEKGYIEKEKNKSRTLKVVKNV